MAMAPMGYSANSYSGTSDGTGDVHIGSDLFVAGNISADNVSADRAINTTKPENPYLGEQWLNTEESTFYIWNGKEWVKFAEGMTLEQPLSRLNVYSEIERLRQKVLSFKIVPINAVINDKPVKEETTQIFSSCLSGYPFDVDGSA